MTPVDAPTQRKAVDKILYTLSPEVLQIPDHILDLLPPRAHGHGSTRESFAGQTGIGFDFLAPPATSTHFALQLLLHPQRINRLVLQQAMDGDQLGPAELISTLLDATLYQFSSGSGHDWQIRQTVNFIVLDHLIQLANTEDVKSQVKAVIEHNLDDLYHWLDEMEFKGNAESYRRALLAQMEEKTVKHLPGLAPIPPGAPIGMGCFHDEQNHLDGVN